MILKCKIIIKNIEIHEVMNSEDYAEIMHITTLLLLFLIDAVNKSIKSIKKKQKEKSLTVTQTHFFGKR